MEEQLSRFETPEDFKKFLIKKSIKPLYKYNFLVFGGLFLTIYLISKGIKDSNYFLFLNAFLLYITYAKALVTKVTCIKNIIVISLTTFNEYKGCLEAVKIQDGFSIYKEKEGEKIFICPFIIKRDIKYKLFYIQKSFDKKKCNIVTFIFPII